jgi:hypothetical protein
MISQQDLIKPFINHYKREHAPCVVTQRAGSCVRIVEKLFARKATNSDAMNHLTLGLTHDGARNITRITAEAIVTGKMDIKGSEPIENIVDFPHLRAQYDLSFKMILNERKERADEVERAKRESVALEKVKISQAEIEAIIDIYLNELGKNTNFPLALTHQRFNMAKKVEVLNKHRIRYILVREGVYKGGLRQRMSGEEIVRAQGMMDDGLSLSQTAKNLSRSVNTVSRNLAKHNGLSRTHFFKHKTCVPIGIVERATVMRANGSSWGEIQQELFSKEEYALQTVKILAGRLKKAKDMNLEIGLGTGKLPNLADGNPLIVELPHRSLANSTFVLAKGRLATFYLPVIAAYSIIGRRAWAVKRFEIPLSDQENYIVGVLVAKKLSKAIELDEVDSMSESDVRLVPHIATGKARQLLTEARKLPVMSAGEAKRMVLELEDELVRKRVATQRFCTRTFSAKKFA